jgi:glycosyltransferase involved in cell wall biosynthesis
LLHGANIVCLSSIDWAFNWQLPQEVASAFAAGGNRVLFVENTGVRRPALKDAKRLRARFRNWRRAGGGVQTAPHGVEIHSPLLLPFPYAHAAVAISARILLRSIRKWLQRDAGRPFIVITFLPTPLARAVIRGLKPDLAVYYCADRLTETSAEARKLHQSEPQLLAEADLVLTTSHGLQATAAAVARRVEYLPCGVRSSEFERARRRTDRRSAAGLAGPVIGFTGTLRKQIDVELLTEAAGLAPELSFVFVGPVEVDVRRLAAHPNVRFIGPVPHSEVVRHTVGFDVGILPYIITDYTADVMPVKLKEYLAAGLPVLATALPEICRFADQHPGLIAFAGDAVTFVTGLRAAVAENAPGSVARRMEVARRYDWTEQIAHMSGWMESLLATRR